MHNIRNEKMQNASGVVPLNGKLKAIVQGMDNPIKDETLISGDGGAWRAYHFQLLKPHRQNSVKNE